jgi:hypothetical protein
MTTKKTMQTELNEESKKFWKEIKGTGRYVKFIDGGPICVRINDWNIRKANTDYGKKPYINTEDGRILKVESLRLQNELNEFVGRDVELEITRFDSIPNPLNTYYIVNLLNEF